VTIPVRDAFTLSASAGRFGVLVESADAGAQLVVERATYWDASGVTWAGGTSAMGRKLP
jgi:hypothetical protein